MKQFYRVKHSINTLNNKNNKAKRYMPSVYGQRLASGSPFN